MALVIRNIQRDESNLTSVELYSLLALASAQRKQQKKQVYTVGTIAPILEVKSELTTNPGSPPSSPWVLGAKAYCNNTANLLAVDPEKTSMDR